MKLLQLNMWGGRLEYAVADLLRDEQPDIITLQEAISIDMDGTGLFLSTDEIQRTLGIEYAAFGPAHSFTYMNKTASYGNCVLSRFPIEKKNTVFTYLEYKEDFVWDRDEHNIRNFVHARIRTGGKFYNVITHHGFWIADHKDGNEETLRQMTQLADYIKGLDGPVILAGDFNLHPKSTSLEPFSDLRNLSTENELKTTRTSLTKKSEVCDYIFVSDEVDVTSFRTSDRVASDHMALIAEFD